MNSQVDNIEHQGTIVKIDTHSVYVKIIVKSACSSCHAKGICSVAEMEEKIVEVKNSNTRNFKTDDSVTVTMKKSLGTKAVILGYIAPFFVLLFTLIITLLITNDEGIAGLASIGILVPYYIILYTIREKISKSFDFMIKP